MITHTPRAWVEVDLGALMQNAAALRKKAGVPLMPVVKADAYGLGAARIVEALDRADPWGFAVATVDEGMELRELGVARPVLLLTPPLPEELDEIRAHKLVPALSDPRVIEAWGRIPGGPWHLSVDTGMNRTGVRWSRMAALEALLRKNPAQGAFTHFYSAELEDGSMELQEERFRLAVAAMPSRPAVLHAEHSAAIVRRTGSEWDLVRPGIFLYGVGSGPSVEIQPAGVVSLRARIVELREVRDGDGVSYHGTYQADGPRTIATTALGYADGYRRVFSNSGWAAVNGRRASVAGLVTMDMTMLDVTGITCKVGDVATFIGGGVGLANPLLSVAESANLSPYEMLTALRSRLPRVYVE